MEEDIIGGAANYLGENASSQVLALFLFIIFLFLSFFSFIYSFFFFFFFPIRIFKDLKLPRRF